jgi:hypothetical protein
MNPRAYFAEFGNREADKPKSVPPRRCKTCGAYKQKNDRTGRWVCPARESHVSSSDDARIWRGILKNK